MQYLYLAQAVFTVWMLLDVYRRQEDAAWFWIILLVPVVGAWAYFFLVKAGDYVGLPSWLFDPRQPTLEELRYEAERAPTLARDLALAEALIEKAQHSEAIPYLEAALKREPDHAQVLYYLALCRTEQGHPEEALPLLERILARDPRWADYAAWRLQIAARAQNGDSQGALESSRELVRRAPTLQFQCLLAERLLVEGLAEEAQKVLEEALEAYRFAPSPFRRRNRRWAREAQRLQKQALLAQRS